ncbi:MAG: phosphotransferase enzyme family protein [Cyclobacteriaceae bacterium]
MEIRDLIPSVLSSYGLNHKAYSIEKTGSGHINQTFMLKGENSWILQQINTNVFKQPERIAGNIRLAANHLNANHPDYLFPAPVRTLNSEEMAADENGSPWRLFPYIPDSITLDALRDVREAREAASGFGKLTSNLDGINTTGFEPTIPDFHNLTLRFLQLRSAIENAADERRQIAENEIKKAVYFSSLVGEYEQLISRRSLVERIVHNDTKINNILFSRTESRALCVIDLDTLMQGYFIYDLGDMIRTFVSPVSEEERDTSKIVFRQEFYEALLEGYLSEMGNKLSQEEKRAIPFSGMMMTYIMAIRFLADFLNGNIYYRIHYPDQNLVRARNQLKLLEELEKNIKPVN